MSLLTLNNGGGEMKKILIILVGVMLLGFSNYGVAQETEETAPSVTVGLKMWLAAWEYTPRYGQSTDYGSGLMYGPALNIRSGKLFAGLTYLTGGGFGYEETNYKLEVDRTDMDLSIGYNVHPNIGLFLGYKTTTMELEETTSSGSYTWENEFKGPAFGLTAHSRIGESRWLLFGTLSYVSLASTFDGVPGEDFIGPSFEFGVAYTAETMPVSVMLGYKYQSYKEDVEDAGQDTFSGLTLGVNYTF